MNDKIGAIIVTYNSGSSLLNAVNSVLHQVNLLCIVDNHSDEQTILLIKDLCRAKNQVVSILNNENRGLAYAYNSGIVMLVAAGCTSFLLMDDDSVLNPGYVDCMIEASKIKTNCIFGGNFYEVNSCLHKKYEIFKSIYFYKSNQFKNGFLDVGFVISSGSFLTKEVYQKVGFFEESLFIDYVDIEYSLRAKSLKINSMICEAAKFTHKMGDAQRTDFLGAQIITKNYSPIRRFYIYRNRVVLWKRYGKKIGFMFWDIASMLLDLSKIVLVESSKIPKLNYILKGLYKGITNVTGKCPYQIE